MSLHDVPVNGDIREVISYTLHDTVHFVCGFGSRVKVRWDRGGPMGGRTVPDAQHVETPSGQLRLPRCPFQCGARGWRTVNADDDPMRSRLLSVLPHVNLLFPETGLSGVRALLINGGPT